MLLLGLLLIAATAAFTGLVIADNLSGGPVYHVTVLGNTIATMNTLEIFLSGLALALIFCLGLAMMGTGGVLAKRRRLRVREARRVRRAGPVGDAVPTTPNGTGTPVTQPGQTMQPGRAAQPGQAASTVEPGTEPTTGAAAPAATTTATGPDAASATAATTRSGRPRRHMHLFGH
jgi:hypothetical protein